MFLSLQSMINPGNVIKERDSISGKGSTDEWLTCCSTIEKQGGKDGENFLLNSISIII
jgi:hypothetical protein